MIKRVEHVGIMADDMDASISFYERLLGFQARIRVSKSEKELTFLTHDGLPDFEIELIRDKTKKISYAENGLVNHLAFVVEDLDQVVETFKENQVVFINEQPKEGIGRRTIRFKGPNGETLQLVEERKK